MKLTSMRKKGDVHSAVGVRFDVAVPDARRPELTRVLTSASSHVTFWNVHRGARRTYARVAAAAGASLDLSALETAARGIGATLSVPPAVALDVRTRSAELARVAHALAGPGAPAGITDVAPHEDGYAIEFDPARTSLALVLATIDAVAGGERSIDPLRPLEDDVLAAFAAARLGEPGLTAARIVETYF